MLLFRIQLRVPREHREGVVNSLLRLAGPTRAMRGCISCGVYRDLENEDMLLYMEDWTSSEALTARLRADDVRVLLSILDLACETPIVRFDAIGGTQGMGVIAAARAGISETD